MKEANMLNYQDIKELSWKRPLNAAEQAQLDHYLAAHPEARAEWQQDALLSRSLRRLPNVPVSSNFTSLVLQQVQRAPAKRSWLESLNLAQWLHPGWLPRVAGTCAVFALSAFSVYHHENSTRHNNAEMVASAGRVAALPRIDWLKDFETISRLSKVQVADDELLAVLR